LRGLASFYVCCWSCALCCAYVVVLTLWCLLCFPHFPCCIVVRTLLVVLVCLLCCACFVFLTLLVVSLCLLWCAYFVVLCYAYFVFLNCLCLLSLLCLLACFRFASLGCPLLYFKNENCTNKHKRTALFHLNHRPGFCWAPWTYKVRKRQVHLRSKAYAPASVARDNLQIPRLIYTDKCQQIVVWLQNYTRFPAQEWCVFVC